MSSNKDKAIAFLKWITAREQQVFLSEKTNNLPANREALASIPQVLSDFAKGMDNATHPSIWPLNEDPLVVEVFAKGIQAIMIGEATPQKIAFDVQKMKKQQLEKMKK